MGEVSLLLPLTPIRHEQILPWAALTQWTATHRLWLGHTALIDPHEMIVHAAAAGFRVPVGIGVTLTPMRHALQAATQARSIAVATGHPCVVGYGPGTPDLQEALLGAPLPRPVTHTAEYVDSVRRLLAGEQVAGPGGGISLPPLVCPPVLVGIGALRRAMATAGGRVADVIISWLTPPTHVQHEIVAPSRESAVAAGRPAPYVVAVLPTAVDTGEVPLTDLVMAGAERHVQADSYRTMLTSAGVEWDTGDRESCARALVSADAVLMGSVDDIVRGIRRLWAAGADEVVLNLGPVVQTRGHRAALAEAELLVREATR